MKLNHTICSNQHVTMTDSNYQQVFNYFRHCYFLTEGLLFEDRKPYLEKMNELLQETWYDFIWRTDLCSEVLVRMQAAKENMLKQALDDISFSAKQVSARTKKDIFSEEWLLILILALVLLFAIFAIIIKLVMSTTLKRQASDSENCISQIDVRRMNVEPPKISDSSSDGHVDECFVPQDMTTSNSDWFWAARYLIAEAERAESCN